MKSKIFLCCIFIVTLLNSSGFSQGWEKSYGGIKDDFAYDVVKTSDGGYIAVGSTQSFGAGGTDVFIIKINSSGALKWTRVFGGTGNDIGYSVAQASNGDLIVAGVTASFGAGGNDVYLIRLTANGKTKWTKTFGNTGNDEARAVKISGDNIYVAGSTTLPLTSNSNFYLLKTDGSGNLLWQKNYGPAGNETAYSMDKTFDGGFAISGLSTSFGNNRIYLVKVTVSGDTMFTRNYDWGSQSPGATGVTETTDHGLVMTGFAYGGSGYGDLFLMKVSSTGTLLYNETDNALANSGVTLAATDHGGVIVLGDWCNFGCTMELLKYDSAGTQLWHKPGYQYANSNSYASFSGGYAIKNLGNASYLACGYTYLPTGTNADFLIVKTDTSGKSYANPPVLSYNGPTTFCIPGSVTMTAPSGYSSYQWTYVSPSHGLSYISGATTSSYTASATGNYSCIMKSSANDVTIAYANVRAVLASAPVVTTTGSTSFCAAMGQTCLMSATFDYSYNYQWKLNGANISGATNSGYYAVATGNYNVVMTNTCGTFTSSTVAVDTAAPPAVPVISYSNSGSLYVVQCNGYDHSYNGYIQVPEFSGTTYQWYHNGTVLSGATSYATFPYVNNENYTCTITTTCGSATSAPFPATYNVFNVASSPLWADGPTQGCGVTSVTLSTYYGMDPYQWYNNFSPIAGATSSSYLATASGDYYCEFYDYDCGQLQSLITQVDISASPAPTIAAVGSAYVCTGTVTLNASPVSAGVTYSWYKDNSPIGVATSSYSAATSGNYKCYVTQSCGSMFSNTIYVSTGVPVNTTIAANKTSFCANDSATLSLQSTAPGQTYHWKLDGTSLPGATSSSYYAHAAGHYVCFLTNNCGTISSNGINLTVKTIPPASITAGSTAVCTGDSIALTANSGAGLTYQWFRYNNIYTIYGSTNQTYYPKTADLYSVRVTGANGCTKFSSQIATTSAAMPVVTITLSNYPAVCDNENLILKSTTGTGFSYQWKKNGANISGATDSIYAVSDAGTYSVRVTNICGSVTVQSAYPVQIKNLPSATITPQGATTFCAGGSVALDANTGTDFSYTWEKNGAKISGETNSSYTATTAGTYKVIVTNNNGCSNTSAAIIVSVPCRTGETLSAENLQDIKAVAYPNPYNESFTLFVEGNENDEFHVSIKDITGKIISAPVSIMAGSEIEFGQGLSAGYYMVEISSGEKRKNLKVIKL